MSERKAVFGLHLVDWIFTNVLVPITLLCRSA